MLLKQQPLGARSVGSSSSRVAFPKCVAAPISRRTLRIEASDSFKNFFDKLKGGGKGSGASGEDAARKAIQVGVCVHASAAARRQASINAELGLCASPMQGHGKLP